MITDLLKDLCNDEVSIWESSDYHGRRQFSIDIKSQSIDGDFIYNLIKYGFVITDIYMSSHHEIEKITMIIVVEHVSLTC